MASINIYLTLSGPPELHRVEFFLNPQISPIISVRGKTGGASNITNTFQWTSAVRALTYLLIRTAAAQTASTEKVYLEGEDRSLAASLDYAISKQPSWLIDMFGTTAEERPQASRLFIRTNPERKRKGPVEISLNYKMLSPENINVFVRRNKIESPVELEQLAASIASDLNFRDHSPNKSELNVSTPAFKCIIGESDLIVTKAITTAWQLEELFFSYNIGCSYITLDWSDEILKAIENNEIHIAIYNSVRTKDFIAKNNPQNLRIANSFGSSMGGRNFFILARRDSHWHQYHTLEDFRAAVEPGAVFALPQRSDMFTNLLQTLGCTAEELEDRKIKIIQIPVSMGLEVFDLDPNMLLLHGQNVRLQAQYRGQYLEVVNFDSIPTALQEHYYDNSQNCIIYSKILIELIPEQKLYDIFSQARKLFFEAGHSGQMYQTLCEQLVKTIYRYGIANHDEAQFIVRQILFDTYRFGDPYHKEKNQKQKIHQLNNFQSIGFAFLPPKNIRERLMDFQKQANKFVNLRPILSEDGNLPHITIIQGNFTPDFDYKAILDNLSNRLGKKDQFQFEPGDIVYKPDGWYFLMIKNNPDLTITHDILFQLSHKHMIKPQHIETEKIWAYTEQERSGYINYGYRYLGKAYYPHITLGWLEEMLPESIANKLRALATEYDLFQLFTPEALTVYQMGEYGAHTKTLAKKLIALRK